MLNYEIIPAILTDTLEELEDQVKAVSHIANSVQIDYVDGYFIPEITCCEAPLLHDIELDVPFEVHLMVEEPIDQIRSWAKAGAERAIGHIEQMSDQQEFVTAASELGLEVGLALKLETPLSKLQANLIPSLNVVLLMGHEVGVQGAGFDDRVLDKIAELRALYPSLSISVDGGINVATLPKARQAGANVFVAGSAIFTSQDPVNAYNELRGLL